MAISVHNSTRTAALALVVVLVACCCDRRPAGDDENGIPYARISREFVCGRAEAQLRYPNATELTPIAREETFSASARCGAVMSTPDDQQLVYDWYTKQLQDRGYKFTGVGSGGPNVFNLHFQNGKSCRELASIAVDSPRALLANGVITSVPKGAKTIFEYDYSIVPSNQQPECRTPRPVERPPPTTFPLTETTTTR